MRSDRTVVDRVNERDARRRSNSAILTQHRPRRNGSGSDGSKWFEMRSRSQRHTGSGSASDAAGTVASCGIARICGSFPRWTSPVRSRSPARFRNPRPTGVSSFRSAPLVSPRGRPHLTEMSELTYPTVVSRSDKPLVWLAGGDQDSAPVRRGEGRGRVPPATSATRRRSRLASFATDARHRRALSRAADHCRADADAIVIAEVFSQKTRATPRIVIENAMRRLAAYDEIV